MRADQLDSAQNALKLIRGLPVVLVALSLALFGLALAIAPGWRRNALRAYGIGFVLAGAAALLAEDQAGQALVDALVQNDAESSRRPPTPGRSRPGCWSRQRGPRSSTASSWSSPRRSPDRRSRRWRSDAPSLPCAPSGRRIRDARGLRRAAALVGADARDARTGLGADPDRAARRRHRGAPPPARPRASRRRHGRGDAARPRARRERRSAGSAGHLASGDEATSSPTGGPPNGDHLAS